IDVNQVAGLPLTASPVRADERIVNYIKGLNYLDDRLSPLLAPPDPGDDDLKLAASQRGVVETIRDGWRQARLASLPVVQLLGADVMSKRAIAWHAASSLGRSLHRLTAELLPTQAADLEVVARLWHRESILSPVALYLDAQEIESAALAAMPAHPVSRFL